MKYDAKSECYECWIEHNRVKMICSISLSYIELGDIFKTLQSQSGICFYQNEL